MSNDLLKPDKLTNGAITDIILKLWRGTELVQDEELIKIHDAMKQYGLFGEIAQNIDISFHDKKEADKKLVNGLKDYFEGGNIASKNKKEHITLFDSQGTILIDEIYGSASGSFRYVYRSKGFRTFWFESGIIELHNTYGTIDENGFYYSAEEIESYNIYAADSNDPFPYFRETILEGKSLISYLVSIKEDFHKDYAIEYLLYPRDVDILSTFSVELIKEIWDSIIDLIKDVILDNNSEKKSLLNFLIEFTENENILPLPSNFISLFEFYRKNINDINSIEFNQILESLKKLNFDVTPEITESAVELIDKLESIKSGVSMANEYHDLIFKCLNKIFANSLIRGKKEVKTNEGRKRIDIVYDNLDKSGFFSYIREQNQVFCPKVFIECKNYSSDIKNPEIDQLLGRLGRNTGKLGILICREVDNESLLLKRCKDALHNDQGYILYLEDKDIIKLLELKEDGNEKGIIDYLLDKWDKLILNQ